MIGAINFSPAEVLSVVLSKMGWMDSVVSNTYQVLLWDIRIPRLLGGVLIGAGLSVAGAAMQGLFKNPLADPGLIGISSGASLSASLLIVLGVDLGLFQIFGLSFWTFIGAALTTFLVLKLAQQGGETSVATMLLAGVAINAISGSITGLLTFISEEDELRTITFWLLGSLAGINWNVILILALFTLPPMLLLINQGKALNAFMLGDADARFMGVNTKQIKIIIIIATTLCVGTAVSNAGVIGFVGLVVPHICRMMVGSDHRKVLPLSAVLGALLLVLSDLLCRTVVAPAELPIGVITSIIGSPLFLSILIKEKRKRRLQL